MVGFISGREGDFSSPASVKRFVRIDSKGRISIPADVRRSLGLEFGSEVELVLDLEKGMFFVNGQVGVIGSMRDCGSFGPGSNPGPGPEKEMGE